MIVHIEVRKDAGSVDGLQEKLAARLKEDLGVSVDVKLVEQGQLDTVANLGEGKAKRLLDRRPAYTRENLMTGGNKNDMHKNQVDIGVDRVARPCADCRHARSGTELPQ